MPFARCLLLALFVIAVGGIVGCSSAPMQEISRVFQPSRGDSELQAGIKLYEDGRYAQASKSFENALNLGLGNAGQVTAHKYLAFIHCVSKRERQCRGHFNSALDIDPSFDLSPAEAGHPMWGPVFRSVKAKR